MEKKCRIDDGTKFVEYEYMFTRARNLELISGSQAKIYDLFPSFISYIDDKRQLSVEIKFVYSEKVTLFFDTTPKKKKFSEALFAVLGSFKPQN